MNVRVIAFFAACTGLVFAVGHWQVGPRFRLRFDPPRAISGDEPHYLLVTNSLLRGEGLTPSAAYDRVPAGSVEAGLRFHGVPLAHHTIVRGPRGTEYGVQCFEYSDSAARFVLGKACAQAVGSPLREFPSHPPAFPMLMAALIAPLRPGALQVERDFTFWQQIFVVLTCILTFGIARAAGVSRGGAAASAALLLVASPWLAYSRSFYSEVPIGLALAGALLLYLSGKHAAAALCLGVAVWMKPPFGVFGAVWALQLAAQRRFLDAARFCAVLGLASLGLLAFNHAETGRWLVGGNFGWVWGEPLAGAFGTLLSPQYGLFPFVPWAVVGVAGAVTALKRERLAAAVLPNLAIYAIILSFVGFSPATCWGPRYWVPLLPWIAALTLLVVERVWVRARVPLAALAAVGAVVAAGGALRYSEVWDQPAWRVWTARS